VRSCGVIHNQQWLRLGVLIPNLDLDLDPNAAPEHRRLDSTKIPPESILHPAAPPPPTRPLLLPADGFAHFPVGVAPSIPFLPSSMVGLHFKRSFRRRAWQMSSRMTEFCAARILWHRTGIRSR